MEEKIRLFRHPCVAPIALGGFYSFNGMNFYNCLVGGVPAKIIKEIPQSGDTQDFSMEDFGL